jgi:hypothetical protein
VSAGLLASARPARAASTSQSHPRARCWPGSPEPVLSGLPVTGRPQMIVRVGGHGRSC